jgi:hypothetical protein
MPNDSLLLFMLDDLLKFYYESSSITLFSCTNSGLVGRFNFEGAMAEIGFVGVA